VTRIISYDKNLATKLANKIYSDFLNITMNFSTNVKLFNICLSET